MAAAAYKVSVIAALGSPGGPRKAISMTASDVNGQFWTHPSGANEIPLHGTQDVWIVDAILSAAGTDTSQSEFYVGGASTGFKLQNATSVGTIVGRPLQLAPIRVPAGQAFRVTQLT
jgi:hypothetical protein